MALSVLFLAIIHFCAWMQFLTTIPIIFSILNWVNMPKKTTQHSKYSNWFSITHSHEKNPFFLTWCTSFWTYVWKHSNTINCILSCCCDILLLFTNGNIFFTVNITHIIQKQSINPFIFKIYNIVIRLPKILLLIPVSTLSSSMDHLSSWRVLQTVNILLYILLLLSILLLHLRCLKSE